MNSDPHAATALPGRPPTSPLSRGMDEILVLGVRSLLWLVERRDGDPDLEPGERSTLNH